MLFLKYVTIFKEYTDYLIMELIKAKLLNTSLLLRPLFESKVSAGFPSPADDYVERTLDLNELCIKNPPATFFVRAEGESMRDAGITAGDLLVVDRSLEAVHGDIVIAALDGEFTVKFLHTKPQLYLQPANDNYSPIFINEAQDFSIFGVVTNILKRVKRCHLP